MPSFIQELLNIFHVNIKNKEVIKYLDIILRIIIILILIKITIVICDKLINRFFKNQSKFRFGMNEKKAKTLRELSKSILRYGLYFVAAVTIFQTIWPNISTTIALTSVLGVAVGFGSQNLVKDVISGFFILFEDQFAVGDYITIDGRSGTVEALGIRTTRLRDFSGELHIIPNGSIDTVTNKTRGEMRALVELTLPYTEDIDLAIKTLEEVNATLKMDMPEINSGPEVLGVSGFSDNGAVIRIIAKTEPMKQWDVEFELRKRIKRAFDERGIILGFSRKIIYEVGGGSCDDHKL